MTDDWNPNDPDATRVHYDLAMWSFDQQAELASDLAEYITGTTLHPDGGAWASAGWWNWPEFGWVNNPPLTGLDSY